MPARLVYSPKAYVYTKDQAGVVYNLTPYVTAGDVQRKINQVSTAEITLRNPYKYFTGGMGQDRLFHPMDPITIYLERLQGFPVRVFTGYLDTTPYYQMYPGTITLTASCTLKRLLYTYFDPSLPYVIAFFTKYGWINTGTGSIISSKSFDGKTASTQADVEAGKKPFTDLQDGSLAKLLWAILFDIGEWQDTNIYIEDLPTGKNGIAERMQQLMQSMQQDQTTASDEFTSFLENVIGAGAQGSGGGGGAVTASGPVKGGQAIVKTVEPIANKYNVPLEMVLAVMYIETGFTNQDSGGNPHFGWFQVQNAAPPYAYGLWSHHIPTMKEAHDLGLSAAAFCSAAAGWASHDSSLRGNIQLWAEKTQGVTGSNNPYYVSGWPAATAAAKGLISQFGGKGTGSGATSSVLGALGTVSQAANAIGASQVKNQGVGNLLATVFPHGTKGTLERVDMGVDFSLSDGVTIGAPGAGSIVSTNNNFANQPIVYMKFDQAISGYQGFYASEGIRIVKSSGRVALGETIAVTQSHGTGIELGFTHGGSTPAASGHYTEGAFTKEGQDFAAALGVPALHSGHTQTFTVTGQPLPGAAAPGAGGTSGGSSGSTTSTGTAQAFVAELQLPSMEDQVTAIALGAEHKGLMHDQSLLPFVQQVAQASMRSFQSLPNGDFYAFYPDYFGEMGHHQPYWYVHDIEILTGGINLTDDALATHVFAVGDNSWPVSSEQLNMLYSAGSINIFNAFLGNGIVDTSTAKGQKAKQAGDMSSLMSADEAVKFIERYGARPLVQNYPMVRSTIFEMLLAYQQFLFAWSNQFKTPFTFTFMPEIFPGGKIGFPEHGIQMYVNSVTHSWDYAEGGFTTTAELSAPGLLAGANAADFPDIPEHMVQAIIEPVRKGPSGSQGAKKAAPIDKGLQQVASTVDQTVQQVISGIDGILGLPGS